MIRRALAMLALAFLAGVAVDPPAAVAQTGHPWSIRLSAGGCRLSGGDLAAAIDGLSDYVRESRDARGGFGRADWGFGGGVELAHALGPRADVFVSLGLVRASRRSEMESSWWGVDAVEEIRPSIEAALLILGAGFDLHRTPGLRLRAFAGAGLATGAMGWESTQRFEAQAFFERSRMSWEGRAVGPAFLAGLTLERHLAPRLALVGEVAVRRAVLSGLRGRYEATASDLSGSVAVESSTSAWTVEYASGTRSYPWLVFHETKPTAAFYNDVREFRLSLGGVSFGVGLRYRF